MDFVQWLPALTGVGGLGVGGAVATWAGSGKARREVRSAVLKALTESENARWYRPDDDSSNFGTALHELETAALIARIPRPAVQHYTILAEAASRLSRADYEDKDGDPDMGAGGIEANFARTVQQAAEVITQLAWRPWVTKLRYRSDLKRLREKAANNAEPDVKRHLASVQHFRTRLPDPLGDLVEKQFPSSADD